MEPFLIRFINCCCLPISWFGRFDTYNAIGMEANISDNTWKTIILGINGDDIVVSYDFPASFMI